MCAIYVSVLIYVCMCVCVYACMRVCVYARTAQLRVECESLPAPIARSSQPPNLIRDCISIPSPAQPQGGERWMTSANEVVTSSELT